MIMVWINILRMNESMKTNHTSERTSSHIESLDAIKAFSIVLIVF